MSNSSEKIIHTVIELFIEQRKKLGLSHEKLGEKAKLHRSTISLIENKKRSPTLKNCIKIAQAMELDLSKLLAEAENRD